MATQQISSFDGGTVVFEYDYDLGPGSNVLTAQYETPPGETIEVIVSNGRQLVVNEDGDYELRYQVRCEVS